MYPTKNPRVKPKFNESRPSTLTNSDFTEIVNHVVLTGSAELEGDTSKAQKDFERMLVRRHKDGAMPKKYEEFLQEYSQDPFFLDAMAKACPQAIGNDLLYVLLSDFELGQENSHVSDYDSNIHHPGIVANVFSPAKNFVQTMFTKTEGGNTRMTGSVISFAMMHQKDDGSIEMIALMYDPNEDAYDYCDVLQDPGKLDQLDEFYKKIRETMSVNGKKNISFQEMVDYCHNHPDDQPKFLPMASAMAEFKYQSNIKQVLLEGLNTFYPQEEGLMCGYNPMLAKAKSTRDAQEKNKLRRFYFKRLGSKTLPESMRDTMYRGHYTSQVQTVEKAHSGYGDDCQIVFDRACYEHEQSMSTVMRFFLSVQIAVDAYRINAPTPDIKAK